MNTRTRQAITRLVAVVGALAVCAVTWLPGAAAAGTGTLPKSRNEEWWFKAWEIESKVWPQSVGKGMTVALLDTGVNASLPDLQGAVLPGKNFATGSGDGRTDTDAGKTRGHGTGMASLIVGQGTGIRMAGVAPEAKILPLVTNNQDDLTKAIRYAADQGAQVISISQTVADAGDGKSGCFHSLMQQSVSYAIGKGSVVVAGAGNDGLTTNDVKAPASCAGVLAVGAADNKKKAWPGTQRQPYVQVAAPGAYVRYLAKDGKLSPPINGTSSATALASAAVALVRSKYPNLGPREVVQRMVNTAIDIPPTGEDQRTGKGVIFPEFALTREVPKTAPNPTFDRLDQWRKQNPAYQEPGQQKTAPPAAKKKSEDGSSNTLVVAIVVVGALVLIVAILVLVLLLRRRRPPSGPRGPGQVPVAPGHRAGPPGGFPPGPPMGQPGQPGQPGPPPGRPGGPPPGRPNFGPPPGGQGPWQGNQR